MNLEVICMEMTPDAWGKGWKGRTKDLSLERVLCELWHWKIKVEAVEKEFDGNWSEK